MSHHKIEVKNLCFKYPDGYEALKDVSFCIQHSESVGIIGANGAGKSTLLMLLMGILFPSSGEVLVGDVHLTKKTLSMIRQRLGMVFQDSDDQLFMPTVYEDVAFGPRNFKLDEKEVEARVVEALTTVGIPHLSNRASFRLSGGEKRCAAIATVVSMHPDVLIMDEPSAGLDPKARRKVINLLNSFDHTKIITSHDLDLILDTCDRVIIMKDGQLMADRKAYDILVDEELLDKCGLERPFSIQGCPVCNKENKYYNG